MFVFHFRIQECILSPFYDFLFKLIFGLFLLDRAGWTDLKRQISKMGIDFAFPRKSVFPHMISWGTDFLRILFFAFSMQICSFQCKLSGINLEIFFKFDHWKQTSQATQLAWKFLFCINIIKCWSYFFKNPIKLHKSNYAAIWFFSCWNSN